MVETKDGPSSGPARSTAARRDDGNGAGRRDAGRDPDALLGLLGSCAQPQIADIGFRGDIAHVGEHIEEAVDIGLGGSLGPDAAFIDWVVGAMPVDRVPDALLRVVWLYQRGAPTRGGVLPVGAADRAGGPAGDPERRRRGGDRAEAYRLREEMNGIEEPRARCGSGSWRRG